MLLDYTIPYGNNAIALKGNVKTSNIELGKITANNKLGSVAGEVAFDVNINKNNYNGYVDGNINHFDFNNYRYNNITAKVNVDNNFIEGIANIDDPNINISIEGEANLDKNNPYINAHALANTINFNNINLTNKYHHLSADTGQRRGGLPGHRYERL